MARFDSAILLLENLKLIRLCRFIKLDKLMIHVIYISTILFVLIRFKIKFLQI